MVWVLESFCFFKNLSISSKFSNCCYTCVVFYLHVSLSMGFVFLFSLLILVIYAFTLFSSSVLLEVYQLYWSFQETYFELIAIFCCFSVLSLLISALLLIISFLALVLGLFSSSFASFFRWKLRLLIFDFFSFLMVVVVQSPSHVQLFATT